MTNSYRTTCENCGGNNFVVTESKGIAHCFNCLFTKRLGTDYRHTPVKRSNRIGEIRSYYLELANYWHSCLTDEHRTWLYRRGVSDYSINTLKLGYCPPSEHLLYRADIAVEAGVYYRGHIQLTNRITFPFWVDGTVTDFYGRTLEKDNDKKYIGLFGGSWKRGADFAYMHDYCYKPTAFTRVVRTEGLLKAVVANQYGIPTVADPGTLAHRDATTPMQGQVQVICFDSQVNHRRELVQAIKKKASKYQNVKIATLPLRGKSKQDCDSYILEYGIEDFKRVIDGALDFETWQKLVK